MRGAALTILLTAASATTPLAAQVTAALEGGGSRINYSGFSDLSALSLSPSLEWLGPSARLSAEGSFAQFSGGGWSLQGSAAGSGFSPQVGRFRGELGATATSSTTRHRQAARLTDPVCSGPSAMTANCDYPFVGNFSAK